MYYGGNYSYSWSIFSNIITTEENTLKGIGYPKSSNFSIMLYCAQNEAVCV